MDPGWILLAGNNTRVLVETSPIPEDDLARLYGLPSGGIIRHRFKFMASNELTATGEVDREYAGESAVELRNGTGKRLGGEVAKSIHNGGVLGGGGVVSGSMKARTEPTVALVRLRGRIIKEEADETSLLSRSRLC